MARPARGDVGAERGICLYCWVDDHSKGCRMGGTISCMFDTNVFNRIVDEDIALESLVGRVTAYATHIQRDEINNTKNVERRAVLAKSFDDVVVAI